MKTVNKTNQLTNVLFAIYLIAIFEIIVFKMQLPFSDMGHLRKINLIPFSESLIINGRIDFSEIIMNFIIFIPLGIYLEFVLYKRTMIKKVLFIFLISLLCEVLQYIFAVGASDITDIINNTAGGVTGLLIIKAALKIFRNNEKVQKAVNILATIGTVTMLLLISVLVIVNL